MMASSIEDVESIYQQDDVRLENRYGRFFGMLRILKKMDDRYVQWVPDASDANHSWATPNEISTNLQSVSYTPNGEATVSEPRTVNINIESIYAVKLYDKKKKIVLCTKTDDLADFTFTEGDSSRFLEIICEDRLLKVHPTLPNKYILLNKKTAEIDKKLADMNLTEEPQYRSALQQFQADPIKHIVGAPKKVLGFINNLHKDPINTTYNTISHLYEAVLDGAQWVSSPDSSKADVVNMLQNISVDDDELGFEIITTKQDLAKKPTVSRLGPLTSEEFESHQDEEGRVIKCSKLKKRIFQGGISPSLRPEVWCLLLGVYDWDTTSEQRRALCEQREKEYGIMKTQWQTMSEIQENNNVGFRERKAIVEKDVNRTDRTHPFYEGENNHNLVKLNDILMTYVVYNFDLGYVQGMSDLLAPILYTIENEAISFWCFVGFMNMVKRNFDYDQKGMREQLQNLRELLRMVDPELSSFLESQDSANMTFCFRWLLVLFKRELNYTDTLRLWEVLWTRLHCENFHLCCALAILEMERDEIVNKKFSFADILKHINNLSMKLDIDKILVEAEATYHQLAATDIVPNQLRAILALPLRDDQLTDALPSSSQKKALPGKVMRVPPQS